MVAEVAALRQQVEEQERLLLARLARLGREVAGWRQERVEGLRQEVAAVSEKIHQLEEKCQQPAGDFLQVGPWSTPRTFGLRRLRWLR